MLAVCLTVAACGDSGAQSTVGAQSSSLISEASSITVPTFGVTWANEVGGAGMTIVNDVFAGATRAFIAGSYATTVDFHDGDPRGPSRSGTSPFIASVDANGRLVWKRVPTTVGSFDRIAATTDDDVVVAGYRGSGGDSSGCGPVAQAGGFLVKYDGATGFCLWMRSWPDGGDRIRNVRAEPDGELAVVGQFFGTIDLGNGHILVGDDPDNPKFFVARLDSRGLARWAFVATDLRDGTTNGVQVLDVATDPAGNVYYVGSATDRGGVTTGFVISVDGQGAPRWQYLSTVSPGGSVVPMLADLRAGRLAVVGRYQLPFLFAGQSVGTSDFTQNEFVLDFGLDGHQHWARIFAGQPSQVVVDDAARVNVVGEGTLEYGDTLFDPGDIFLVVLDGNDGSAVRVGVFGSSDSIVETPRISFAPGNGLRLMSVFFIETQHFGKTVLSHTGGNNFHGAYMSLVKLAPGS